MSTKTNVRSPRWTTVSIESRVVPGTSETITLLSHQRVEQARLPDVRPPEDRDADRVLRDLRPLRGAREALEDRVEQVARAVTVQPRDRQGLAEAEAVELVDLVGPGRVVELVRDQEHRTVGAAQQLRDLLVAGRHSGLRVHDEQDEVGLVDRGAPERRSAV